MINIACVLKSGGKDYNETHVYALQKAIERNVKTPYRFVCLSDLKLSCETIELLHGWKGWWSKIELFDWSRLNGRTFYVDLDTMPVSNFDDILNDLSGFHMLENFWSDQRIGSGLMYWDQDLSHIYESFKKNHIRVMNEYMEGPNKWGDQSYIWHTAGIDPQRLQKKYPSRIVSYKFHVKGKPFPKKASIICFHGKPRPWETNLWRLHNGSRKV